VARRRNGDRERRAAAIPADRETREEPAEPIRTTRTTPAGWRRWRIAALVSVSAVVAAAGLFVGVAQLRRTAALNRLPSLPDLSGRPQAIAQHLREKDAAARAEPESADRVGALCLAYHADMFYDEAERCYTRQEELNRQDWRPAYYRALAEGERGSPAAQTASIRRVVDLAPAFGPAWWRLGEVEFKQAHYDRAGDAWQRASSLPEPERRPASGAPVHVVSAPLAAYAGLGLARLALVGGDADRARTILESLTAKSPRFGPAFRLLADTYLRLGRNADAERALHRANNLPAFAPYADPLIDALALESRNSTFLLQQAAEDSNVAWNEFLTRRALEFDPGNADVVYKLGFIERTLGNNEEALALFRRYQQMTPGDFQVLGQIGSCLGDLGRFDEAESSLRLALTHGDDALTRYNLGFVLTREGRLPEAVAEYERALQLNPTHLAAMTNLASVLLRQGQLERASRELARALAIEPDNPAAHTNLGLLLAQQGRMDEAARQFEEALRINPRQREAEAALRALGRR
jgi:tetratricopeptide (TPR) repeat protein